MKIRNVECRKLPVFRDFFISARVILALSVLKASRKQQNPKERNLNFSKLFSDRKNIDFQENYKYFCMGRGDFFLFVRISVLH